MQSDSRPLGPADRIDVRAAFREVNALLLELLEGFSEEDWRRPTVHATRDVKDLAAHLLHGNLRRLSVHRDGYMLPPPSPIASVQDLIDFIQADNRAWMNGARRLSPRILIALMRQFDEEAVAFLESLAPDEPSLWAVDWAGEKVSRNWFDVAREYTEKWHHQQQLRDATGRPPLYREDLFAPVLETFARGLPHAYRDAPGEEGLAVSVAVTGAVERGWTLRREGGRWALWSGADPGAAASISLDADKAWRLWTKGLTRDDAERSLVTRGDRSLAAPLLGFVAIMA